MYHCYILKSVKNSQYYIGSTADKYARLKQHNQGKVKSTMRYIPWKIVYNETFTTLKEARAREKQIKGWKSRSAIERLLNKI